MDTILSAFTDKFYCDWQLFQTHWKVYLGMIFIALGIVLYLRIRHK